MRVHLSPAMLGCLPIFLSDKFVDNSTTDISASEAQTYQISNTDPHFITFKP